MLATHPEISFPATADAKANVRFRTQNGTILTDFDESALVTKSQPMMEPGSRLSDADRARADAHESASAGRALAEAAREHAIAITHEVVSRRREIRERSTAGGTQPVEEIAPIAPVAPMGPSGTGPAVPRAPRAPRAPSIPAIAGGKVVSGVLNGGGPVIQIATMNGDIVVRKLK